MTVSPENKLILEDVKRVLFNALQFTLPTMLLTFMASLQTGADVQTALRVSLAAVWGVVYDLIKKWKEEHKYK